MPSRFFGFLQNGKDLDMPSAATILIDELERATDAGMNALTHDRTARMQANRNIFLYWLYTKKKIKFTAVKWWNATDDT